MNLLPAVSLTTLDAIHHCKAETLLNALPSESIDMIITSPPYGELRDYKGFVWDFEYIAHQSYRVLKPGGVLVWVVGDSTVNGSETLASFEQALYFKKQVGFRAHDTMIWRKVIPGLCGKRYTAAFEYMFVLSKDEPATFNPIYVSNPNAGGKRKKDQRTKSGYQAKNEWRYEGSEMLLENVWSIGNGGTKDVEHPAVFPEKLAERHILTWSNPGEIVLDYFSGSGTTAKIARKLERHFLACDISLEYVELAQTRLKNTDPMQTREVGKWLQPSLFEAANG